VVKIDRNGKKLLHSWSAGGRIEDNGTQ